MARTDYEAIKYSKDVIADKFAELKIASEAWYKAINNIQAATTVDEANAVTYLTTILTVD